MTDYIDVEAIWNEIEAEAKSGYTYVGNRYDMLSGATALKLLRPKDAPNQFQELSLMVPWDAGSRGEDAVADLKYRLAFALANKTKRCQWCWLPLDDPNHVLPCEETDDGKHDWVCDDDDNGALVCCRCWISDDGKCVGPDQPDAPTRKP